MLKPVWRGIDRTSGPHNIDVKLWFILSFSVSITVELLISPLPFNKIQFCYFDFTGSIRNLYEKCET
jgi:hypothetical protein